MLRVVVIFVVVGKGTFKVMRAQVSSLPLNRSKSFRNVLGFAGLGSFRAVRFPALGLQQQVVAVAKSPPGDAPVMRYGCKCLGLNVSNAFEYRSLR
jgi:hypothetical protein